MEFGRIPIFNGRVVAVAAVSLIAGALIAAFTVGSYAGCAAQEKKDAKVEVGAQPMEKTEPPTDGVVYVWSLPNQGLQSLIVLNVIDGDTVDAAYLVPVRIRLKGTKAPGLAEKGGKEARDAVDKVLGGQLRTAQLHGVGKDGIIADFWINPEKDGEKGTWVSDLLIKQGAVKEQK